MSGCFHIVEKFDFAYGEALFSDNVESRKKGIKAFLKKLDKFGVSYNMTKELDRSWFNAIEIGIVGFTNFYENHIANGESVASFDEVELKAISEIKRVIDSDADYIKRYGYVFLTHI